MSIIVCSGAPPTGWSKNLHLFLNVEVIEGWFVGFDIQGFFFFFTVIGQLLNWHIGHLESGVIIKFENKWKKTKCIFSFIFDETFSGAESSRWFAGAVSDWFLVRFRSKSSPQAECAPTGHASIGRDGFDLGALRYPTIYFTSANACSSNEGKDSASNIRLYSRI